MSNAITNGTEKQIAWATDIKAQMLHMMVRAADLIAEMAANAKSERTIRKYTAQSETLARGIVNVKACADAVWFIDNRKRVTETDEDIIANAKANGMEVMEDGIRMHRNVITRCSLALAKIAPEAPEPETIDEPDFAELTDEQVAYTENAGIDDIIITGSQVAETKRVLALEGKTTKQLTAIRNSIVKHLGDLTSAAIAAQDVAAYNRYNNNMSGITAVIDQMLVC